jgi:DNA-binding response OmpR family regulator
MALIHIVDDDHDFCERVEKYLRIKGHDVVVSHAGEAALRMARERPPDILLLDIRLEGGMDGHEVVAEIKRARLAVPIVMMSARDEVTDRTRALDKADDFVGKPFQPEDLVARIDAVLRRTRPAPYPDTDHWTLELRYRKRERVMITMTGATGYAEATEKPLVFPEVATNTNYRTMGYAQARQTGTKLHRSIFGLAEVAHAYGKLSGESAPNEAKRLRFAGPRELLSIPLEFLHGGDSSTFLVLDHPFARSVTGLTRKTRTLGRDTFNAMWKNKQRLRVLLVASNVSTPDFPPIPGADEELRQLKDSIGPYFEQRGITVEIEDYPAERASYDAVKQRLRDGRFDILHYAGHAFHDADKPEESGLVLPSVAGNPHEVTLLKARELRSLLSRSSICFAFLSACECGTAEDGSALLNGEAVGIADAMVHAGVSSVLGYRWPLPDDLAAEAATTFYKSLAEVGEIDVALLKTRNTLHDTNSDQPVWLSPVLVMQG